MLILSACIAASAVAAGSASPSTDPARGFLSKEVEVGGQTMKYVVYVPREYQPTRPIPAIIFLNGAGECGRDGLKQIAVGLGPAIMFAPEKWPFIVMFPQKQDVNTRWEDEDDMVMAVLEKTRQEYTLDRTRLYLTGLSQGGHGTWAIAARHPELFAAIAPICGWGDAAIADKLSEMPIWIFHGDADEAVPVSSAREMERFLAKAGGSCKMSIYAGVGHNSWDRAYQQEPLAAWFLEHRL